MEVKVIHIFFLVFLMHVAKYCFIYYVNIWKQIKVAL